MSARKTPVLLREGPLTGTIWALLRYRERDGRTEVIGDGRQDVTADFDALACELLLDGDGENRSGTDYSSPDIAAILDGVADGEAITLAECKQVRGFRERLVALIERHNTTGHGASRASHDSEPDAKRTAA
jgi:hypothetical protein